MFFDRDGTLMHDVAYASRPEQVRLLPGAAHAVQQLAGAGYLILLVSNQSGLGRGLFSPDDYQGVHARFVELLGAEGAMLDGSYHCPHAPDAGCECRKPGLALFQLAAREHDVELSASWCIGDRWRDVEPARALGATGLLVPSPATPQDDLILARAAGSLASSLPDAVHRILRDRE